MRRAIILALTLALTAYTVTQGRTIWALAPLACFLAFMWLVERETKEE